MVDLSVKIGSVELKNPNVPSSPDTGAIGSEVPDDPEAAVNGVVVESNWPSPLRSR